MQRTDSQNKALHKFFSLLSDKLNEQGLDMKKVIKAEIWWTPSAVKEKLWKPVMEAKYGKRSTTELEKQMEIDAIHENLMEILGKNWGVEYIDFPSNPNTISNYGYVEPLKKIPTEHFE
jgi:hypothetical protein